jgi:hypothetical protein
VPVATLSGDRGIAEDEEEGSGGGEGPWRVAGPTSCCSCDLIARSWAARGLCAGAASCHGRAPAAAHPLAPAAPRATPCRADAKRKAAQPLADDPAAAAGEVSFIADVFFLTQRHLHASLMPAVHRCLAWGAHSAREHPGRRLGAGCHAPAARPRTHTPARTGCRAADGG